MDRRIESNAHFQEALITEGERVFRENLETWKLDKKNQESSPPLKDETEVREILLSAFRQQIRTLLVAENMPHVPDEMQEDFRTQNLRHIQQDLANTALIRNSSDPKRISMQLVGSTLHAASMVAGLLGVPNEIMHKFEVYENTAQGLDKHAKNLSDRAHTKKFEKFSQDILRFREALDNWRLDRTQENSPPVSDEMKHLLLDGYYDITSSFIYSGQLEKRLKTSPAMLDHFTSTWWKKVTTAMRNFGDYGPEEIDTLLKNRSRDALLQRMKDGPAHVLYDQLCDYMEKTEGIRDLPTTDKEFILERLMESIIGTAIKTAHHYNCAPYVTAEHFTHRSGTSFRVRYAGEAPQR